MPYADYLRRNYPDIKLDIEDLYLLESFQVGYLPERVPKREFAALLWADSTMRRVLEKKHPPIIEFIKGLLNEYPPASDDEELIRLTDELLWEIADLIMYNRDPDVFDARAEQEAWVINEITSIVSLENKVVIDAGAGTGKIAFQAAKSAKTVFAIEPVSSLRRYIRKKALEKGVENIYTIDGLLGSIPFPNDFADVLLTCRAIGWNLEEELKEVERIVKPGGFIVHVPMYPGIDDPLYTTLTSAKWQYKCSNLEASGSDSRKYWKQI